MIGELLTGGPSAPFYKSLIESGLGTGFAPSTGRTDHIFYEIILPKTVAVDQVGTLDWTKDYSVSKILYFHF